MKRNVLISEVLGSTLCQHRCEMEWERGEGPQLTHVPLHIPKSRAGGNRTCCTHPKHPPMQPCSLQCPCGDGCNWFLTHTGGFGECSPKEIPLEKPRSRSGLYHALPLITPDSWVCFILTAPALCAPRLPAERRPRDRRARSGVGLGAKRRQPRHLHSFSSAVWPYLAKQRPKNEHLRDQPNLAGMKLLLNREKKKKKEKPNWELKAAGNMTLGWLCRELFPPP